MSTKFFEELVGRECEITLRDDECETATLLAVDGEWLKFHSDYGQTLLVNAGQIIYLTVDDEKKDDRDARRNRRRW